MNFINPIEVLNIINTELSSIDGTIIKKAKKRVIADIELSDNGHYNYGDYEYTKSDIERVVDRLENPENLEFYYFIAKHEDLNGFLKNGDIEFVTFFRQESIYQLQSFIQFISPYYAISFDKFITTSYKHNNIERLRKAFQIPELFTLADRNVAYKGLENHIKKQIGWVDEITKNIREGKTKETSQTIQQKAESFKAGWRKDVFNSLPDHFQLLKNQTAQSMRNLSVQIYNHFSLPDLALSTISHALELGVDGLTGQKIQEDYKTIYDLNNERLEQEKYAPIILKYAPFITNLLDLKDKLATKAIKPGYAIGQIDKSILNELNSTPSAVIEIRDQAALILRSISVDIWNNFSDIKSALDVIDLAVKLKTTADTDQNITKAKQELQVLYQKHRHELICFFCDTNSPVESAAYKKTIYLETYRTTFPKRVQFSYKDVTIPRCSSCSEIHTTGSNTVVLYVIGVGIAGALLGYVVDEHFIIGAIIGLIAGLVIGNNQSDQSVKGKQIKTLDSISQFPPINALLKTGWTFNKPSA